MVRGGIPERNPLGDAFDGVLVQVDHAPLLALTIPDGAQVLASGGLVIRYGARLLGKPHLSIVPGIVALDYGDMLTGEEAWHFLYHKSNLYPRADVVGYRNDGSDDMLNVKQLDLALTPQVLVYADSSAIVPLASPLAVIAPASAPLPERLTRYLPRYDSLAIWQTTYQKDDDHA